MPANNTNSNSFFFTYGTSEQFPFVGGWTEVHAPSKRAAIAAFRAVHPDVNEGVANCSSIYNEVDFVYDDMYTKGNFGAHCHEVIDLSVTANEPTAHHCTLSCYIRDIGATFHRHCVSQEDAELLADKLMKQGKVDGCLIVDDVIRKVVRIIGYCGY